jgi:hypothetical protein
MRPCWFEVVVAQNVDSRSGGLSWKNPGHELKHELRQLITVILFFFVAFQLLALTEAMMLEHYGIRVSAFLKATVAALVVAKAWPAPNCIRR